MLAIPNCGGIQPMAKPLCRRNSSDFSSHWRVLWRSCAAAVLLASTLLSINSAGQDLTNSPSRPLDFKARARRTFIEAQTRYRSETNSPEAAWQFARACFDLGEFSATDSDRAELAETGITVSKKLVATKPSLVQAHYYLAMNLGQLARTKSLGALRLVDQMEVEFTAARKLDPHFDCAGPDRNLGLLYMEAPSFGSIGSRSKARQHLRKAVELAPEYPENRLNLIEAYTRWGDPATAARELKLLGETWVEAHKKFSGEDWAQSWIDWEKRFKVLKQKLADTTKQLEAPRLQK
jgi:hypothetical protein